MITEITLVLIKESQKEIHQLLTKAKENLPQLKTLLNEVSNHWGYEDPIYRFFHHSFKVYSIQQNTQKIVTALQELAPHIKLNNDFMQVINKGTGKEFDLSHNENWLHHTSPMLEAFFLAKHMLEMICKYSEELQEAPQILPSGWATVLYLYNLR